MTYDRGLSMTIKPPDQGAIIILLLSILFFAIGYFGGHSSAPAAVQPASIPTNYDPARAGYIDALHEANAATERCWQTVVEMREKSLPVEMKK